MPNPIADPFVENVVSPDIEALIDVRSGSSGAVTVVINGVGPTNALNGETARALKEAFETLHGADAARIVFLRGAGGTFSSGADHVWLKAMAEDLGESEVEEDARAFAEALRALSRIPCLTVALVEGEASGAGAGLAATCDMAIASTTARFGFPSVKMGGVPAVIAPYVAAAIGPRRTAALFMTGRVFDARHALAIGLIDEADDDLAAAAERLAREVFENGPEAMREAKKLAWDVIGHDRDAQMDEIARRYARSRLGEEGREGLAATLEQRLPNWAPR
ncbi:MAG TPA: enoyl-CoA hydratase-related protein [Caulobacteraceae bacterium]|jgi:methylglutaconyl-CoA hydratase